MQWTVDSGQLTVVDCQWLVVIGSVITRKNWFKAGTLIGEKLKADDSLLQSSSFQVEVAVNCQPFDKLRASCQLSTE